MLIVAFFYIIKKAPQREAVGRLLVETGGDLFSRPVTRQVSWALKGLTTVFGMRTGGTPLP